MVLRPYQPEQYADCIESIWFVETFSRGQTFVIPPNQFVDWIFLLGDQGYYHNGCYVETVRIEGIMEKPVYLKLLPFTKVMGIRMYGSGLFPFLPITGKEIVNKNISFFDQEHAALIQQIRRSPDDSSALASAYKLLNLLYNSERDEEARLVNEFYFYMKSSQNLPNINAFCRQTSTNYSSLNRAFSKMLGLTPKKFERLIKFRKAIKLLVSSPEKLTVVGAESGYFDQSHFIKEFKHYMNMSPSEYLNLLDLNEEHRVLKGLDLSVI